ncbi:hypothetical protein TSUD_07100 [Trifolium subterraneum]|uniref:Pentacotripeptide-repeat region of PRORP domain-containing protein n=1 Tax=Trifolium subterraneum TaxID=3900 RepID=A0A2Z6M6K7_TRISU|nr:hypothetical protein TSUD_07100 [Trifolium subterraneum]
MPSPFGTGVAVLLILLHGKEKAASVLVAALQQLGSANCSVAPASAYLDKNASSVGVEKLPEEMNDMKISDDKFHTRDGDQFQKALEVLSEMKGLGLRSNIITFSMLIVASEKMDDMEAAQMLLSQAKKEHLSLVMSLPLLHI